MNLTWYIMILLPFATRYMFSLCFSRTSFDRVNAVVKSSVMVAICFLDQMFWTVGEEGIHQAPSVEVLVLLALHHNWPYLFCRWVAFFFKQTSLAINCKGHQRYKISPGIHFSHWSFRQGRLATVRLYWSWNVHVRHVLCTISACSAKNIKFALGEMVQKKEFQIFCTKKPQDFFKTNLTIILSRGSWKPSYVIISAWGEAWEENT